MEEEKPEVRWCQKKLFRVIIVIKTKKNKYCPLIAYHKFFYLMLGFFSLNLSIIPKQALAFLHVCSKSHLQTMLEKEKLLVEKEKLLVNQTGEKHCGKRRNCSLRAISPFPTVFSTRLKNFLLFLSNSKLSSANSFSLVKSLRFIVWESSE